MGVRRPLLLARGLEIRGDRLIVIDYCVWIFIRGAAGLVITEPTNVR